MPKENRSKYWTEKLEQLHASGSSASVESIPLIVLPVQVNDTGNTRLDTSDTHLNTGMKLRFINGSDNL